MNQPTNRFFFAGLLLLCAATLMYEVILTRLLSVICWYYLAFVSVSMAMFGMTAGALMVQLRPGLFAKERIAFRLYQSVLVMAISMPITLLVLLAVPVDLSLSLETLVSFLLFSAVIAVPFFFSGVAVCISLTRIPLPTGRIYAVDLTGAALGCVGAVGLLKMIDAPSGVFAIAAILFLSAAAFGVYAEVPSVPKKCVLAAISLCVLAGINASTLYGIQPIWSKGAIDRRTNILLEKWNPISKVRAYKPVTGPPLMWGPSPRLPNFQANTIYLNIDNSAATEIIHFDGDLSALPYLRYDVTSLGAELRAGGAAAIIGVGGGRDVLNCAVNHFKRIVGIEVNSAIVDTTSRRLDWFSGFSKIPGFELHTDEGRSYLTRSGERFDLIQASLVDSWAATTAGAMTLSENALYTVDGWRVFYEHLTPGGIVTFSRWYDGGEKSQTYRLFSVAYATLLSEGVSDPASHLALIKAGRIATLLLSNRAFSAGDIRKLRSIAEEMEFTIVAMPGEQPTEPELRRIMESRTLQDMAFLHNAAGFDYSPTFDTSPYFFNAIHLRMLPIFISKGINGSNMRAVLFLFAFMVAAIILVITTILVPARIGYNKRTGSAAPLGGILYFVSIGLGFMLLELAMMQQLSIFLGHPIYALVVVLAGLILSSGIGSLISDRWPVKSSWHCRIPPVTVTLLVMVYLFVVMPLLHAYTAAYLWQRILICFLLVAPCGIAMGFCFPVGMRWLTALSQDHNLPWMWALNGAAGTLGSFVAMVVSMETSIGTCVLLSALFYLMAASSAPRGRRAELRRGSQQTFTATA